MRMLSQSQRRRAGRFERMVGQDVGWEVRGGPGRDVRMPRAERGMSIVLMSFLVKR